MRDDRGAAETGLLVLLLGALTGAALALCLRSGNGADLRVRLRTLGSRMKRRIREADAETDSMWGPD